MKKCIIFPSPIKKYNNEFINLTSLYETFFVEREKCDFYFTWKHNESHLSTNTHYNYILPNLSKLLDFSYDLNDFNLIEKKDSTNTYDLSYMFPKNDKNFEITYNGNIYEGTYKNLIGYTNYDINKENFMKNTSFEDINPDYHLLFFAPHQCCILKNLSENNGRKLLISGDSQLIPLVPILAYYFKEIVYLDKRKGDDGRMYDIDINEYDLLYAVSKYSYNKYEITNFKKISPNNRIRCAIVATGKMENNYIREWVEYHKSIGIKKIFLFDNNDTDGEKFETVINDYISSEYVTIIDKRGLVPSSEYNIQSSFYREGYKLASKDYNWIAIIDIDEFITFSNEIKNINDYLAQSCFDNYDCIRLNWKLYNDSNLIKVENNDYNCLKRFTTWKSHPIGKSILRSKLIDVANTIEGHGTKNVISCDEEGNELQYEDRIAIVNRNPHYKYAWINHYKTKTIEEFVSIRLKRQDINIPCRIYDIEPFFSYCERTPEKEKLGKELLEKYKIAGLKK